MKVHRLGKSDGRGKPYYPYFFNPGDSDVLAVLPLVYKNQIVIYERDWLMEDFQCEFDYFVDNRR